MQEGALTEKILKQRLIIQGLSTIPLLLTIPHTAHLNIFRCAEDQTLVVEEIPRWNQRKDTASIKKYPLHAHCNMKIAFGDLKYLFSPSF